MGNNARHRRALVVFGGYVVQRVPRGPAAIAGFAGLVRRMTEAGSVTNADVRESEDDGGRRARSRRGELADTGG
jgi:hypothetical protein